MEKITHYSREGYEGNYLYTSVCGKDVKTHQDNENSSINPREANCPDCLKSIQYKTDSLEVTMINHKIKRRIYIESDILQASEFRTAQASAMRFSKSNRLQCVDRIFSEALDFAWHDLDRTWEAVKKADEIYATSSLMPIYKQSLQWCAKDF